LQAGFIDDVAHSPIVFRSGVVSQKFVAFVLHYLVCRDLPEKRGPFDYAPGKLSAPVAAATTLCSVENQLLAFGLPYGAYGVCSDYFPRAALRLPWAILDGSLRERERRDI
jgi:hypothetical protein